MIDTLVGGGWLCHHVGPFFAKIFSWASNNIYRRKKMDVEAGKRVMLQTKQWGRLNGFGLHGWKLEKMMEKGRKYIQDVTDLFRTRNAAVLNRLNGYCEEFWDFLGGRISGDS